MRFIFLFLLSFFCSLNAKDYLGAWYDPPTSQNLLSITKANDPTVLRILDQYHALPLNGVSSLEARVCVLTELEKALSQIVDSNPFHKTYKKLSGLVVKKKWYLSQIINLYQKEDPFSDIKVLQSNIQLLTLVNKISFDFKLPVYWGLFWLEAIDPCHRFLTKHYMDWVKSKTLVPFFVWLETKEISFEAIQVDYLSTSEILDSALLIEDNLLKNNDGTVSHFNHDNNEYIYVLSSDKKLFVKEAGVRHRHTSLTHGKPVFGAGSIKITNGKITFIDTESGHYQPTPYHLANTIYILETLGLDIHDVDVKYYDERESVVFEKKIPFMKKYYDESFFSTLNQTFPRCNNSSDIFGI